MYICGKRRNIAKEAVRAHLMPRYNEHNELKPIKNVPVKPCTSCAGVNVLNLQGKLALG